MTKTMMRTRTAFSLMELLIAITIVAILIGLLVPVVQGAREAAAQAATMNNLSQCAKAALLAHDQRNRFPGFCGNSGANGFLTLSFHACLLPYVDLGPDYNQPVTSTISETQSDGATITVIAIGSLIDTNVAVPVFLSSMDCTQTGNGAGVVNYPVNVRLFCEQGGLGELPTGFLFIQVVLPLDLPDHIFPEFGASAQAGPVLPFLTNTNWPICPRIPASFPDGVSNTLVFATKYMNCGANGGSMWGDTNVPSSPTAATFGASMLLWQQAPAQGVCDPLAGTAVSFRTGSVQVAMCDASVRSVAVGISQKTWQALHTPGGEDVIGPDWVQ